MSDNEVPCAECGHGEMLHATEMDDRKFDLGFKGCTECACIEFIPPKCTNSWGTEDSVGVCSHTRATHGERGDCRYPGCLCASYTPPNRCTCPGNSLGGKPPLVHRSGCPAESKTINPEPGSNTHLQKWVDPAMFQSEPLAVNESGPKVYLLGAPQDPLGAVAAACKMYKGEVVRDLADVTDDERRYYLAELRKTKLTTPLEAVQFHFLIEGVTRSFTHQLVRQRTAAYAQESLRFAVVEDSWAERVALPPSLAGTETLKSYNPNPENEKPISPYLYADFGRLTQAERNRVRWDYAVSVIEEMYQAMVNDGMPAEDARGLVPHNMTTRVHYVTNLRSLMDHAGNRLCTQAQFEWRLVFSRIAEAIRERGGWYYVNDYELHAVPLHESHSADWQWEALSDVFRPVCYQIGKCAFEADFDRKCSIRNRVQANADLNRPSSKWGQEYDEVKDSPVVVGVGPQSVLRDEKAVPVFIGAIQPAEWLLDPGAAR